MHNLQDVYAGKRLCTRDYPHYHMVSARKTGTHKWFWVCKVNCQGGNLLHADVVADLIDSGLGVKTEILKVEEGDCLVNSNQVVINPSILMDFRDFMLRCGSHELWVEAPWDPASNTQDFSWDNDNS